MVGQVSEYIHSGEFYDLVNGNYFEDFEFYRNLCLDSHRKVLELCCGTGRLTIPLYESGVNIEGLDINKSMLYKAIEKANNRLIKFHNFDIVDFQLDTKYDIILIPFNSLQCIYNNADVERVLTNIYQHLTDYGLLIFDVYNPDIELMVNRQIKEYLVFRTEHNGKIIEIFEKSSYDSKWQVNRAIWSVYENNVIIGKFNLDTRCFYPQELDMLLKYNGFNIINKYGDFKKNKFTSDSRKQIYVCNKV